MLFAVPRFAEAGLVPVLFAALRFAGAAVALEVFAPPRFAETAFVPALFRLRLAALFVVRFAGAVPLLSPACAARVGVSA
ncbi:hypothetical protein [Roseivivax sp.]